MRPYIYGKRNLIHIIDLRETVRGLVRASRFISQIASQGSLVLFVGTKRQAQDAIRREAQRCHMPFVAERWIGGTFTNFRTIRNRLARLDELERLISTGEINAYSKKRRATLLRELQKVHRNLSGMRTMNRLPGAVVVVDSHKEGTGVKEARTMGIPTVALIDTDSDPDMVDLVIPGNDDSIRSIDLVLKRLSDAVIDGMNALPRETVEKLQADFVRAHTPVIPHSSLTAARGPSAPGESDASGAATPGAVGEPPAPSPSLTPSEAPSESRPELDAAPGDLEPSAPIE